MTLPAGCRPAEAEPVQARDFLLRQELPKAECLLLFMAKVGFAVRTLFSRAHQNSTSVRLSCRKIDERSRALIPCRGRSPKLACKCPRPSRKPVAALIFA